MPAARDKRMRALAFPFALSALLWQPVSLNGQQPGGGQPAPASAIHVSNHDRDRAQHYFVEGAKGVSANHLPAAVAAFTQAAALDPGDRNYEAALAIARDNLATQLMQQALKARLQGDTATWHARMGEAAAQNSHNPLVLEHQKDIEDEGPPEAVILNGTKDDAGPVVELKPAAGTHSFHLMLPKGELLRQVLGTYGITPTIDKSIEGSGAERVHFDADDVTYAQAEQMLTLATGTFLVPLDPGRALLALDTKENRTEYQRLALETVYLPALTTAELNDVGNVARNVFEAQQATVHESNNTLTIRAPALRMRAFNFELNELLAGRSEVMLDVDIYEVQTQKTVNEGAEIPQSTTLFNVTSEVNSLINNNPSLVQQIISSGLASPGNIQEIALALIVSGMAGSTPLSQPFAYFGGGITTTGLTLTQATANLQLNNSDTRILDKLQLRLLDQEGGTIKIGERYPIVTSSYSNLATGSTSIAGISGAGLSNTLQNLGVNLASLSSAASAAVPQVQYQDIGLNLTATPRIQQDRDISLKLQLQLSSLSGAMLNSNPIINNRQTNSIINVKPGERTVLVSQLSNQESATLIGLPFLSEIPGFEFGTNRTITNTRDSLVIILTPHIVRLSHTQAEGAMVLLPTHS
jgi:general secretion pathway protein D